MMHLEVTESSSTKNVYYSANKTSKSQSVSFEYTVENYTKTQKIETVNKSFNFFEQEVFSQSSSYESSDYTSKVKVEESSKMQDLFNALLQVGKTIKEKIRSFFKRKQN